MSGFLAAVGAKTNSPNFTTDGLVRLLRDHSWRGREVSDAVVSEGEGDSPRAILAGVRDRWELDPGFAGLALIGRDGEGIHVVCDATLYYRGDLRRRLAEEDVFPRSDSAADLIASAWRAFGEGCVNLLEGDFAFVLWDAGRNQLFCARDPFGTRSLFHRRLGDTLLVASTPHPLIAATERPPPFDPKGILSALLTRPGRGEWTAWRGVRELPAGHALSWIANGPVNVRRVWYAVGEDRWRRLSASAAAPTLADMVAAAVAERSDPAGVGIALSGGQDSTAVLAGLRNPNSPTAAHPVHVVTLRYPHGDRADEAVYVNAVLDHFGLAAEWVDTGPIHLFDDVELRAARWSRPLGHSFEGQNRTMARALRSAGTRIMLTGHGGDNVFFVSDEWMMADLLRRGRWLRLHRCFRDRGYRGGSHFFNHCLRPALPLQLLDIVEVLRSKRLWSRPGERPPAPWAVSGLDEDDLLVENRGVYHEDLAGRLRALSVRLRAWMITDSVFTQITAILFDLLRDEGIELRNPLLDRRLVRFALSRPAAEFNRPGEGKALLKQAMRGRLPDLVLDPRPSRYKTGVSTGYFDERFDREAPEWFARLNASREKGWILAEMGLVRQHEIGLRLDANAAAYRRWQTDLTGVLCAEQWLRLQSAPFLP